MDMAFSLSLAQSLQQQSLATGKHSQLGRSKAHDRVTLFQPSKGRLC